MKVLRKKPQAPWEQIEIENTLKALQTEVDGYIETITFAEDTCLIVNEEGRLKELDPNIIFLGHQLLGIVLMVGIDGEEFCDVPEAMADWMLEEYK